MHNAQQGYASVFFNGTFPLLIIACFSKKLAQTIYKMKSDVMSFKEVVSMG